MKNFFREQYGRNSLKFGEILKIISEIYRDSGNYEQAKKKYSKTN
jgi:hypothetical protein